MEYFLLRRKKFIRRRLISRSDIIKKYFKEKNFPFNLFCGTRNLILKTEVNLEFEYVGAEITQEKKAKLDKVFKGFDNCIQTVVEVCNLN